MYNILYYIFLIILILICIIHIPRLYLFNINNLITDRKNHCEDLYHKEKNLEKSDRIFCWVEFSLPNNDWNIYIENLKNELIYFYRKELKCLIKDVSDKDLVLFKTADDVKSYIITDDVICTWIDNENQIIRTSFDHEWCSGYFFLNYAAIISKGECPELTNYNYSYCPFIYEYYILKLLINKDYLPISKCFEININNDINRRINYKLNLIDKPNNISSRIYILWNVLQELNNIYPKDYNILIPIPFVNVKNINNNIGVIFIKYPKTNISLIELENNIKNNLYHSIVTNMYLRSNLNIGVQSRKNVDLVFSSGYVKNPTMICKNSYVSYSTLGDYGIYCQTTTLGKETSISLTFNTKEINFDSVVKSISKKYEYKLF